MNLKESLIVTTTLTKLFPMVVLFSLYLMSYGGAFPGGGFQGGVILGTMIVITEAALERRLYPDRLFRMLELAGVLMLVALLWGGWVAGGQPFGGLYAWRTPSLAPGNPIIWILGFAIYLEVGGSMVLIFRRFLFWRPSPGLPAVDEGAADGGAESVLDARPARASRSNRGALGFQALTACTLAALGVAVLFLTPPLQLVFHEEVESFRLLTREFGIRNMVTTVYLGPRMIDTVLEVFVVLLAVFGLQNMGEQL